MKKYEAIVILDERNVDDQGKAFSEEFEKRVKGLGGTMIETMPMGKKQFTYEIKKRKTGIYWDFKCQLDPSKIAGIKDAYRLDEKVLRLRIYCEED